MMRPVYLVDFAVYKPPEELRVDRFKLEEQAKHWPMYSIEMRDFMVKVFEKSGINPHGTYLPAAIHPGHVQHPKFDMDTAMLEARQVMTGAVGDLLNKTGLKPEDIDILVTNCSIFCPTPSLASMLVNHFKFREDIQSYNLGGMGCGNGVVSIGLIKELLAARPNLNAIFVPAEITTYAFYPGAQKNFMVANVIFRMGGAAILMSNKMSMGWRAKYALQYNVRVHTGQRDDSYGCMAWRPDSTGLNGVYLGRNIVTEAGRALEYCLRKTAPRVMSWPQYVWAAGNVVGRWAGLDWEEYQPAFHTCCDHFAIHAGGYAVLKGVQEGMKLPSHKMLASFASLRDYGNTSCSTTWYVLAYLETCEKVKKGQTVMQVGMGGGMKAGVNVWRALRNNATPHKAWYHLQDCPLTEADLPRAITAMLPDPSPQQLPNGTVPTGTGAAAAAGSEQQATAAKVGCNGVHHPPAHAASPGADAAVKLNGVAGVEVKAFIPAAAAAVGNAGAMPEPL